VVETDLNIKLDKLPVALNLFTHYLLQRNVVATGAGKSGMVAELAAATLTSHGLSCTYLAHEALLHGNMPLLKNKTLLYFSKSALLNEFKCETIFITQNSQVDSGIILPASKELTRIEDCPTQSVIDMLSAIYLVADMSAFLQRWTNELFLETHPGGSLGLKSSA
tara:strand:- start:1022 stop:1516 length:495 start_codon:yes stop_codon:yes gene_type:complete